MQQVVLCCCARQHHKQTPAVIAFLHRTMSFEDDSACLSITNKGTEREPTPTIPTSCEVLLMGGRRERENKDERKETKW